MLMLTVCQKLKLRLILPWHKHKQLVSTDLESTLTEIHVQSGMTTTQVAVATMIPTHSVLMINVALAAVVTMLVHQLKAVTAPMI